MLNASYNLKLRNVKAYIPEYPVGNAEECADMIAEFRPIARAVIGLNSLKIISFGPRPLNFLACNAPIQQLYNLGVEIEENSELDLFEAFHKHDGDERIPEIVKEMEEELLAKINSLGIGPGGLGGTTTALAVNINTYPTHIAGLPVAINICCHVNRHIVRVL